jgi:hypothetical protein
MFLATLNILILISGLVWFLVLAYRQRFGEFLILTPFILFGFNEIIALWGIPLSYAFKGNPLDAWEILVIGSIFLSFVAGFFLSGGSKLSVQSYFNQPITAKYRVQYYFMGVVGSIIVLTGLGIYYYQGAPALGISIFELLRGNLSLGEMALFMSEQRFELTKSHWFGGEYRGQGIINVTTDIGWRFLFAVSLIMCLMLKSKKWFFLCILTGILLIMFQAGAGRRAPVIFSVLFVIIVLSLLQKTSPKHFIILAVLGFGFLMGTTYFSAKGGAQFGGPAFVSKLASQLVERIFLGNAIHDVEVIGFVESGEMEKRFGMNHIEKFVSSFPGLRIGTPLGYRISELRGSPEGVQSVGTYLGFVYSDFGYLGLMIVFFFIGYFLAFVQRQMLKQERDIMYIVMSAMVSFNLAFVTAYGFIGFASNMVMVFLFWGLFHFLGTFFSRTYTANLTEEKIASQGKLSLPR